MTLPTKADVLVVGAGPAGLAAACALLSNGIDVVVVDAAPEPSTSSRAVAIHARTLEVMEDLDIVEAVLKQGLIIEEGLICDERSVLGRIAFNVLEAKYPMMVSLAQADTEQIMIAKLEALGGVVRRGVRVMKALEAGNGVQIEVEDSGTISLIKAQYVVAADGRKSSIREQLGIQFDGGGNDESFILADVKLSKTGQLHPDAFQEFLTPAGLLLYLPLPGNIWRVVGTVDEAHKDNDLAVFQSLTDNRIGPGVKIEEMIWSSRFRVQHGLARQYRKGRVFLAGDAAHVHPPTGGQGMNIGIQDGVRLAQILNDALQHDMASAADLDRYETERRPIARDVVAFANRFTIVNTLKSQILCTMRNWLIWILTKIPFVRYSIAYKMSGLGHGR